MTAFANIKHDPETLAQPYCAAYVFLKNGDKYFFLKRQNTNYYDGYFNLPAGKLDVGETIYDCAIREAKEEAGVTVKREDLSLLTVAQRLLPQDYPYNHWIDFFFYTENWDGEPYNAEPEKGTECGWFSIEELKGNIVPNQEHAFLNGNINEVLIQFETDKSMQKV